jgi:hypothetical protein
VDWIVLAGRAWAEKLAARNGKKDWFRHSVSACVVHTSNVVETLLKLRCSPPYLPLMSFLFMEVRSAEFGALYSISGFLAILEHEKMLVHSSYTGEGFRILQSFFSFAVGENDCSSGTRRGFANPVF